MKVVLPFDDSACSMRALEFVLHKLKPSCSRLDLHLLHVHPPIPYPGAVAAVGHEKADDYYREEGAAALQPARARLDREQLPYRAEILVGEPGETITTYAGEVGADQIVMGTHGRTGITSLLLGSVAHDVIHHSRIPVVLVK